MPAERAAAELGVIERRLLRELCRIENHEARARGVGIAIPQTLVGGPLWAHRVIHQRVGVVPHEFLGAGIICGGHRPRWSRLLRADWSDDRKVEKDQRRQKAESGLAGFEAHKFSLVT